MMKQQHQQMIDERTQFLQKWLVSASSHQSRDSQEFVTKLLYFVSNDKKAQHIFIRNLRSLLQSRQPNLHRIFQYCLQQKTKIFQTQICRFLKDCFNIKNQISLSDDLEKFIMHNIWKSKLSKYISLCNFTPIQIIEFLTLKMRSLNPETRIEAINSLYEIIQNILNGWKSPISTEVQKTLPQMIEKQIYGKQVCFYRGILLQILQDQFCSIKKKGIELLGKAQCFFDTSMIRPLILYMLNDEHQAVRETCLIVLSQIPSFDLQKQDLSALLVCLKQNNTFMRSYTYENLSHINITSAQDFKVILDKLLIALTNYSEDKKNIYIICSRLGRKYPAYVLANLQFIYRHNDAQQPNWKNIGYRAKLILLANIGKDKWPKSLPKYFVSHYLYIRDVLIYAFETKTANNQVQTDAGNQQAVEAVQFDGKQKNKIGIYLTTDWKLYQYIQAIHHSTQGFLKVLFGIVSQWLQQTKICKIVTIEILRKISLSLSKLFVMYDVYSSETAQQLIKNLLVIIEQNNINTLRILLQKVHNTQIWEKLQKISAVVFKITNADKTKIVISNRPEILKRSFVQFSNSIQNQHLGYLRMSQVDFEESNDKVCYYKINFKWKQLRCITLYGEQHSPQFYVSHTLLAEK